MWELFFQLRLVGGGVSGCLQGKTVTVAQLVTGGEEGGEGDKLLLRGGRLGIQVGQTHAQLNGFNAKN